MGMETSMSKIPMTRAEQETETAAERLTSQIESARSAVHVHSTSDIDELEACADRLERAARDLATALRELAHERRMAAAEAK
jgi:polyhydroxyalkanoate synthesis regulator phasin